MELKKKDKELLATLFYNSTKSNRQLSRELGISKETVASRIEFFQREHIIEGFSVSIDYDKLGFRECILFVRLNDVSSKNLDKTINYFINYKHTTWIGKSFGVYDFKISLFVKSIEEISQHIQTISTSLQDVIARLDYVLVIQKYKATPILFIKNILGIEPKQTKKKNILKSIQIDSQDLSILYHLGQAERINYVKTAQNSSTTVDIVRYRVKKLEKAGIIKNYGVVINGNKFNKIWCLLLINVRSTSIENFFSFIHKKPYLSNYMQTVGMWNVNCTFFASSVQDLYSIVNEIRTKFAQDIRELEFLLFFDFYKYPRIPKCIVE